MNTPAKIAIAVGAVALTAITVWGACGLTRHVIIAVDRWGDAAPDLKPTLANFNRPCGIRNVKSSANYSTFYSEGSLMPCGTLAEISTSVVKAGDAVVQTQLVERATAPHIISAMDEFGQTAKHLSSTADSLKGTADALTGTAQGATDTLAEGKRTIAAAQPLLAQLTANGASLQATTDSMNDVLKRKAIGDTLDNLAGITGHADAIIGDGQRVSDKLTADYFKPLPWWKVPAKRAGEFWDIGAALARHTP